LISAFGRSPHGPAALQTAERLARKGRHDEAVPLFERAGDFLRAGESALALRQPLQAAQFFEKAQAWERAARCFEDAGDLREALRAMEEAERSLETRDAGRMAATPRLTELKLKRADLLVRLGRREPAGALLRPLSPSPRVAELLERAGHYEEALQCHLDLGNPEEATRLAGKVPDRERLLAQIHLRSGRPVEAGDLFARLGLAREAAEAYETGREWSRAAYRWEAAGEPRRAAQAYEKAGRPADAARCCKAADPGKAVEAPARKTEEARQPVPATTPRAATVTGVAPSPARQSQALRRARELLAVGDKAKAASLLMPMWPADSGFAEGAFLLAPLLIVEGFYEEALERLRRIPADAIPLAAAPPLDLELNYWEGRCLEAMGELEAAQACYARVTASDVHYRDVLDRTESLRGTPPAASSIPEAAPEPPAWPAPSDTPVVGRRLAGRYELLAELGRGGMGRVYKAFDHGLSEVVAIKTVLAAGDGVLAEESRLLREVQICRRISHPNVVRVYDIGQFDGGLFVTMEHIEGRRLDEVTAQESPLPFARIRSLLSEMAAGLHEAHAQGIVHRDLKPANVMVTASRLKILDFGIASMAGLSARLTHTGTVMGSPMYMSPDQVEGLELDGRTDLYSMGLVAYSLIAGREPFEIAEPMVLLFKKLREDPPDVRQVRPDTPEPWAALLARLLARRREDRFQSAQEVLDALAALPV